MKLLLWNVNGYRSILKKGLGDLIKDARPDVFCLQEMKVQREQLKEESTEVSGYSDFMSQAKKKGYSGVGTFFKTGTKVSLIGSGIGIPRYDDEGRFVITRVADYLLYNVYVPSGTSGDHRQQFKYEFLDAFLKHLAKLSPKDRSKLIVCGDFNICHKPIDIHHPDKAEKLGLTGFLPEERRWLDSFLELGLIDAYRLKQPQKAGAYTWWSFRANSRQKNLGWRIDYWFVSESLKKRVKNAEILSGVKGSDHCPLTLELAG